MAPDKRHSAGFTLIEIMAALAILGAAAFILLHGHLAALNLHGMMVEEVVMRQLTETVVSQAEAEVLIGNLNGSGDFGRRYPDYSWSYSATKAGEQEVLLYDVNVVVSGPFEERSISFFTYNIGEEPEGGSGTGIFRDTGFNRPSTRGQSSPGQGMQR